MPLPIIAVVAARLGIRLATYMIGKQLKKGAAKKLRKAITKKRAEIAKEKEAAGKAFKGKGPQRKQEKVTQRKKTEVDSDLSINREKFIKKYKKDQEKKLKSDKGKDKEEYWDDLTDEDQAKEVARLRRKTNSINN